MIIELLAILVTIAGLFIWNRAESRADVRHMDNKIDAMRNLIEAIKEEVKDFHHRLVEIEKNRK